MDKKIIQKEMFKMFAYFGKEDKLKQQELYVEYFIGLNITTEQACELIHRAISVSEYLPAIAVLIKPLNEQNKQDNTLKTQEIYDIWMKLKPSDQDSWRMEKLPNWAYRIKQEVGIIKIEDCLDGQWFWIEKEAKRIIKDELDRNNGIFDFNKEDNKIINTEVLKMIPVNIVKQVN